MALTNAQKLVLKAAMQAETAQAVVDALAAEGVDEAALVTYYNANSSPVFKVWASSVNTSDIIATINDIEMNDFSTGDGKSHALPSLLFQLIKGTTLNPSDPDVRQKFLAVFQPGSTTLNAFVAASIRTATRAEKLLASGTGSATAPGKLGWEGTLSTGDITAILAAT